MTNKTSESSTPAPSSGPELVTTRPRAPLWATLVATFFGAGRIKPGPGTWGSLATLLVWFVVSRALPGPWIIPVNVALAALAVAVGIPAATRVARSSGLKDPQFVVIDETAGQLITLIGAPLAWKSFLVGFILFRAFDIVKPFPVRQLERLPEGTGIVVDDVAAGLYGLAVMQLLLHFGLLGH
jgi:phosphatidylglycerophosphatase A